jgi:large subunit ribosomal protein L16
MLMPKKIKFRKVQRGTRAGRAKGARDVAFGEYGLQALEAVWLTAQQIEAMRVTISRRLKKVGRFYLRVFPDKPISKKPAETRMGKGKGNVEFWAAVVKRDRVICEVSGLDEIVAKEVLRSAAYKLPMKTRIIKRSQEGVNQESQLRAMQES